MARMCSKSGRAKPSLQDCRPKRGSLRPRAARDARVPRAGLTAIGAQLISAIGRGSCGRRRLPLQRSRVLCKCFTDRVCHRNIHRGAERSRRAKPCAPQPLSRPSPIRHSFHVFAPASGRSFSPGRAWARLLPCRPRSPSPPGAGGCVYRARSATSRKGIFRKGATSLPTHISQSIRGWSA